MHPIWRRGHHPESGSVLVFWAVSIVVLLGIVALSFDIGRIAATQTELQSYADNLALAAAAELDGEEDSIDRALAAAQTLIRDSQTFAEGNRALGAADYRLVFLDRARVLLGEEVDTTTGQPLANQYGEAVQLTARFVRAEVQPRTVRTPFAAVLGLITGDGSAATNVTAEATAGFEEFACEISPLMFCVPPAEALQPGDIGYDPANPSAKKPWKAENNIGDMILLRTGGQGAAWGPGDFGFLDPSADDINPAGPCADKNLSATERDLCLIAGNRPLARCFSKDGVDLEPGQKEGRNAAAFNIFFDIYDSTASKFDKSANYPPAPNVIKGIEPRGGQCLKNNYDLSGAAPLPRDDCFYDNSCSGGGRFGDGTWTNKGAYVSANHGGTDPTVTHPAPGTLAGTRYGMYLAELAAAGSATARLTAASVGETGRPRCNDKNVGDAMRRVLTVAAIDCTANNIQGAAQDVPVREYVRIFLTEPVGYPLSKTVKKNDKGVDEEDYWFSDSEKYDIFVEVLGTAEEETDVGPASVRRVVRLTE